MIRVQRGTEIAMGARLSALVSWTGERSWVFKSMMWTRLSLDDATARSLSPIA